MASVLKKLVRRDARNGETNGRQGSKAKEDNDLGKESNKGTLPSKEDATQPKGGEKPQDDSESNCSGTVAEMTSSHVQRVRTKRLMKEFHDVTRKCDHKVFTAELVEDNLFEWNIKLHRIDSDSLLHRDMLETGTKFLLLNVSFPDNFPFAPPFVRVLAPRIEGGFVLDGGAICMELLTPKGWSSAYTVEAIVLQFSAAVVKGQGRIDRSTKKTFSKKDAEAAYKRLVKTHEKYGWVTPPKSEGWGRKIWNSNSRLKCYFYLNTAGQIIVTAHCLFIQNRGQSISWWDFVENKVLMKAIRLNGKCSGYLPHSLPQWGTIVSPLINNSFVANGKT